MPPTDTIDKLVLPFAKSALNAIKLHIGDCDKAINFDVVHYVASFSLISSSSAALNFCSAAFFKLPADK
jgi:hypothetical protein